MDGGCGISEKLTPRFCTKYLVVQEIALHLRIDDRLAQQIQVEDYLSLRFQSPFHDVVFW